jgi:hypothetical protein
MAAGATYNPIATTTLGSAASSITFTGISQSYTDLVCILKSEQPIISNLGMRFGNGSIDTGNNYSSTVMDGDGASVYAASSVYANNNFQQIDYWAAGADKLKFAIINIPNYSNTTTYKGALIRLGAEDREVAFIATQWRNTAAINQIQILPSGGGNMKAGSIVSIYGIAAA